MLLHVDSKDSDQTGLIWVFTRHMRHFVGLVMFWLNEFHESKSHVILMPKLIEFYHASKKKKKKKKERAAFSDNQNV